MTSSFSVLEGGPYKHKYRVEQFHFHWGKTSQFGAEHLIDGKTAAAEVRFNWFDNRYTSAKL